MTRWTPDELERMRVAFDTVSDEEFEAGLREVASRITGIPLQPIPHNGQDRAAAVPTGIEREDPVQRFDDPVQDDGSNQMQDMLDNMEAERTLDDPDVRRIIIEHDATITIESQADYQPGIKRYIPKVKVTISAPMFDDETLSKTMDTHLQAQRRVVEAECGYLNGMLAGVAAATQAAAPAPLASTPAAAGKPAASEYGRARKAEPVKGDPDEDQEPDLGALFAMKDDEK